MEYYNKKGKEIDMGWDVIGKMLLLLGGFIVLLGLLFLFGGRIPLLGKLPGDILIQKGRTSFFFPIMTCILLSLGLTLLINLVLWILRR